METIIYDSNGYPKLARYELVKNDIEPKLVELYDKYEADFQKQLLMQAKRPTRKTISTVQVKTMLFRACIGIGMVENDVAQSLTKEQLMTVYTDFLDLVEWLQDYCVFAPSRQVFCTFAGIADSNYNWLLQYGTQEQKEIMDMINNYIIDISLEQAQQGNAKETTTKFRMQAKTIGHAVVEATAVDGLLEKAEEQYDAQYFDRIKQGIMQRAIEGDKK
jgi:hypothetical protein